MDDPRACVSSAILERHFSAGDADSSGHLVPFQLGLAYVYLLRPIFLPNLLFFRTVHFKHPSVLSRVCFSSIQVGIKAQSILPVFPTTQASDWLYGHAHIYNEVQTCVSFKMRAK